MSDLQQLARETRSSIEVTKNARGEYQWVVKVYFEDGYDLKALDTCFDIDSRLRSHFLKEQTP